MQARYQVLNHLKYWMVILNGEEHRKESHGLNNGQPKNINTVRGAQIHLATLNKINTSS